MLPPSTISRLDNYSAQTSHHPARQAAADSRHGVYGNNGRSLRSNPLRSPDTWPSSPVPQTEVKWLGTERWKKRGLAVRWSEGAIYLRPPWRWPSFWKKKKEKRIPWKGQWRARNMEACSTAIQLTVPCCTSCICLIDAAERICCCLWHTHTACTLIHCLCVYRWAGGKKLYPGLVNILDLQEWMFWNAATLQLQ